MRIILFFYLIVGSASLSAQSTFNRLYDFLGDNGYDSGRHIKIIHDKIYFSSIPRIFDFPGRGVIFGALDFNGDVLWQKHYDAINTYPNSGYDFHDFIPVGDSVNGGLLVSAVLAQPEGNGNWFLSHSLLKLSDTGVEEWRRYYPDENGIRDDLYYQMVNLEGELHCFGAKAVDIYAVPKEVILDTLGNLLDSIVYHDVTDTLVAFYGREMHYFDNGEKVFSAWTIAENYTNAARNVLVTYLDSLGQIKWMYEIIKSKYASEWSRISPTMVTGEDNSIYIAAFDVQPTDFIDSQETIFHIDKHGQLLWKRPFGKEYAQLIKLIRAKNGDLIGCGYDQYTPDYDLSFIASGYLFRMTATGDMLWEHIYEDPNHDQGSVFTDVVEGENGNIYAIGSSSRLFSTGQSVSTPWVIGVYANGCIEGLACDGIIISDLDQPEAYVQELLPQVKIYPNPASEIAHVSTVYPCRLPTCRFTVLDNSGRKVAEANVTKGNSSFTLTTSDWASGLYYIHDVQTGGVGKLIVE